MAYKRSGAGKDNVSAIVKNVGNADRINAEEGTMFEKIMDVRTPDALMKDDRFH